MNSEQYSLSNLRDIVIPDPPPNWPPAPGVWVMIGIVTAVVMIVCWRFYAVRKKNAYRRAGLALLKEVSTVHDISVLLKRVALAVCPRKQVASLYGETWIAFLNRTCSHSHFSETCVMDSNAKANLELIESAGIWIRYHRIPEFRSPDMEEH